MTKEQKQALDEAKKEQKPFTLEERIEQLKAQQDQAKEIFVKCQGAVEVLEQMLKEQTDKT